MDILLVAILLLLVACVLGVGSVFVGIWIGQTVIHFIGGISRDYEIGR